MRGGRGHAGRLSRRDALATLTDLDRRLLTLLCEQRVLTQTQLERLLADTPARTLRYRTERLTRLGLVGRSRPYRDKGSAPFHYWPTRASDAFVRGDPDPRGGERAEPNPQFLHHAERLSELYALLAVQAPTAGLHLHEFKREGEARELFRADGRERALAPDALIHLHDETSRGLLAFVELDMGTMSHARLKTKAAGYAAYAAQAAWTESHPFCPCLLFLTTTEPRALAFLKLLNGLLDRHGRGNYYNRRRGFFDWFEAAACAHAREPERALAESCWDDLVLAGGGLTLVDCLNKARAAYDARRAEEEAEERSRAAERERLRTSPEALRAHLVEKRLRLDRQLEQFGAAGAAALELLLASTEPMNELERQALAAIVRRLDDDILEPRPARLSPPATWSEKETVELLVESYRRRQRARVDELARRHGVGPLLRSALKDIERGELLSSHTWNALDGYAQHDERARRDQDALRNAYLVVRDREARERKQQLGLATRLTHGPAALYPAIDRERLRVCRYCDEIAYPDAEAGRDQYGRTVRNPAGRCHFCGSGNLTAWNPAHQTRVEYGEPARLGEDDLTFAATAGSMNESDNEKEGLDL
ncbi:MAG TPA: replication-relaxation family protein [Gaiellaceae bacterium]|nr:replication-relaxation family protein [Gaiellaceae bacterium]